MDGRHGTWGRILHVDLSTGEVEEERPDAPFYERFLGGLGLGAKVLWDRHRPGTGARDPESIVGVLPGLLADSGAVFCGRFLVVGKSPASGGWCEANGGGRFGPALKRCGVDGLFVRGAADRPATLVLDGTGARIEDASDLWGLDAIETEAVLRARHGAGAQVATIGGAGERGSALAGVVTDRGRIAARGGLGGVLGWKRLKAVVARGDRRIGVADRARVTALTRAFLRRTPPESPVQPFLDDRLLHLFGWYMRSSPVQLRSPAFLFRAAMARFGTSFLTAMSALDGDAPVRNWGGISDRDFPPERARRIGPEILHGLEFRKYGCASCPLKCGAEVRWTSPEGVEHASHRPEYETLTALGTLCCVDDLQVILRMNDLCNRAGMDTISAGSAVAFAMDCFEAGVLSAADADGLDLRFGNAAAAEALVARMARREGLGDLLADGVRAAAHRIGPGAEALAVHCGGIETPMHDPKYDPGFLPVYAWDPSPGRHTIASFQYNELQHLEATFRRASSPGLLSLRRSRFQAEGKGECVAVGAFYRMLLDVAGGCLFGTQIGGGLPLCAWMDAVTGIERSPDDRLVDGERVYQLRHAFNVREGLHARRDQIPHPRVWGRPSLEGGPHRGVTLDLEGYARSWYEALRWDPVTDLPPPEHLRAIDLPEVVEALGGPAGDQGAAYSKSMV